MAEKFYFYGEIKRMGSSLMLIVPKNVIDAANWQEGDRLSLSGEILKKEEPIQEPFNPEIPKSQ